MNRSFLCSGSHHVPERRSAWSQTEGTVTVVTIGNPPRQFPADHGARLPTSTSTNLPDSKNASTSTREINFPSSVMNSATVPTASNSISVTSNSHASLASNKHVR